MKRYVKLQNGETMVVYSDNMEEETMNLYSLRYDGWFDPEVNIANEYSYNYIVGIGTDLDVVRNMI